MDAIHSSRVFGWIEQPDVSFPHTQVGEPSLCGALSEHSAAVGVPFDGSDGFMSQNEVTQKPSSRSRKQVQRFHASPSMRSTVRF